MAEDSSIKRQIAHIVRLSEINNGKYVKEEGWQPNYVLLEDGRKISRINVISVVVSKTIDSTGYASIVIDDGTDTINMRSFGSETDLSAAEVGDLVLVIGRPRQFNEQKYIVPEIIKKIENKKWIEYRKLELQLVKKKNEGMIFERESPQKTNLMSGPRISEEPVHYVEETVSFGSSSGGASNNADTNAYESTSGSSLFSSSSFKGSSEIRDAKEETVVETENPYQLILSLIKRMDKGDGVDIQELSIKSKLDNVESIAIELMKEGEIFEIRPGRVKVLE